MGIQLYSTRSRIGEGRGLWFRAIELRSPLVDDHPGVGGKDGGVDVVRKLAQGDDFESVLVEEVHVFAEFLFGGVHPWMFVVGGSVELDMRFFHPALG